MVAPKKPFPGRQIVLSLGLIIVSVVYAAWQQIIGQQTIASPSQQFKNANEAFLQALSQINQTTSTTPAKSLGLYTNGSYTGSAADAYYGTVQVEAIIRSDIIADVQFLQYPSDRSTSRAINGQAMPLLTQEAIAAQSAQVDGVSGATFTSQAFRQSLASALAQAKK
ncbi:MAG: FMN-binding protein [bacterium]|nr:FMN-binding protein [bacterium]